MPTPPRRASGASSSRGPSGRSRPRAGAGRRDRFAKSTPSRDRSAKSTPSRDRSAKGAPDRGRSDGPASGRRDDRSSRSDWTPRPSSGNGSRRGPRPDTRAAGTRRREDPDRDGYQGRDKSTGGRAERNGTGTGRRPKRADANAGKRYGNARRPARTEARNGGASRALNGAGNGRPVPRSERTGLDGSREGGGFAPKRPSPTLAEGDAVSFEGLGVPVELVKVLADAGITTPFPIQAATIAGALAGRDVCGRAPTGSGKTLAFGVPVAGRAERAKPRQPTALVLVPTRELADQVADELRPLAAARSRRVHAFYGGVSFAPQLRALQRGVDIAVACPGRLADLVNQGEVRLDQVGLVVVDEADRMADMGFLPEVRRLLDRTRSDRQTLLFSATLDGDVDVLVKHYQRDPQRHEVQDPDEGTVRGTHHLWSVTRESRVDTCADIVAAAGSTVIFVRTKHGADRLARQLGKAGIRGVAIHGNRSQAQRTRALDAFSSGRAEALVATDVAARGIHVDDVACVVHFDLPPDPKDYVHRSGRTARAGAEGVVVALALPEQRKEAAALAKKLDLGVKLDDVDLPAAFGRTGQRHPRPSRPNEDTPPERPKRNRKRPH